MSSVLARLCSEKNEAWSHVASTWRGELTFSSGFVLGLLFLSNGDPTDQARLQRTVSSYSSAPPFGPAPVCAYIHSHRRTRR